MGKKPIVSVTYENERISIKNSLPYLKCVLGLSLDYYTIQAATQGTHTRMGSEKNHGTCREPYMTFH